MSSFQNRLAVAREAVAKSGLKEGLVLHHDEADGLCSGALTKVALEKMGLQTRLICLDKLYPEVVRDVESGPRRVVAYSDIGSGHVEWLSKWNESKNLIMTLDHHDTADIKDQSVHNLNPELDGFSGEREACSSTVAYLFSKTVDVSLTSFAHLALIGSNEIPGQTAGLNLIPLKDGEASGKVHQAGKGVKVDLGPISVSLSRASSILNVLGSVGYYRNGPASGIKACIDGFDDEILSTAKNLEDERKAANRKLLASIREKGLSQLKNIQ